MASFKYRIWCITDSKWEYVLASTIPTVCPTNGAHTIDSNNIVIVKSSILINDGTLKDLTLVDYKQLRYNEIDTKTETLIAAGFTYDLHVFSTSANAQTNWNVLKNQEIEFTWPVEISTISNHAYSLTQTNLSAFWIACKDAVKGYLDSGRTLKDFIYDAVDEAGVDAVVDTR